MAIQITMVTAERKDITPDFFADCMVVSKNGVLVRLQVTSSAGSLEEALEILARKARNIHAHDVDWIDDKTLGLISPK